MLKGASTRHLKCIGSSPVLTLSLMRERRPTSSLKKEMGMAYTHIPTGTLLWIPIVSVIIWRQIEMHHVRAFSIKADGGV